MKPQIPLMNNEVVLESLYWGGRSLLGQGSVVELGCWLGGSIAPVAKGIKDSQKKIEINIHCYDRFYVANDRVGISEVEKAKSRGASLKVGQDTLPLVKENLKKINPNIIYHKGDVHNCKWFGEPIELYIDDVCKRKPAFCHALKTFSPYWIPGYTMLFLMDFNYHAAEAQRNFMDKYSDHFSKLKDFGKYSSCAIFLYTKKLNSIEF